MIISKMKINQKLHKLKGRLATNMDITAIVYLPRFMFKFTIIFLLMMLIITMFKKKHSTMMMKMMKMNLLLQ